jgi:hypothetical protein
MRATIFYITPYFDEFIFFVMNQNDFIYNNIN